uniref:Uncharacterized protein n=1 Tax=Rhizophora mucronata TaxID=61149 RepID=A0A2P2N3G7_RHIMU
MKCSKLTSRNSSPLASSGSNFSEIMKTFNMEKLSERSSSNR